MAASSTATVFGAAPASASSKAAPMFLGSLVELVLPTSCLGCGRGGRAVCRDCRVRSDPKYVSQHPPTVAATEYDGVIRSMLIAYKERGRRDLATVLGVYLGDALARLIALNPESARLVPIPSSQAAIRERGGSHLVPLARAASRRVGRELVQPLTFTRAVRDSAGMGAAGRAENLACAMRADPARTRDRRVLLLDDVVTTGATLREAERALRIAGWDVVGAATIAATPIRRGTGSNSATPFEIPRQ